MTSLPYQCVAKIEHNKVIFSSPSGVGFLVVTVFLGSTTPRVMAYVKYNYEGTQPASLFLDEVAAYVREAYFLAGIPDVERVLLQAVSSVPSTESTDSKLSE